MQDVISALKKIDVFFFFFVVVVVVVVVHRMIKLVGEAKFP